ncbi:hypothetical protein [Streptomyces sp. NPDC002587]
MRNLGSRRRTSHLAAAPGGHLAPRRSTPKPPDPEPPALRPFVRIRHQAPRRTY